MHVLIAALFACGCVSLVDAPLWPPAADYINSADDCSTSSDAANCESTRKTWTTDFDDAIAGRNAAQRTVALCLSTGCDGAIRIDRMLGCAWLRVAIGSAPGGISGSDTINLQRYCSLPYLDDAGQQAAAVEATSLLQMLSVK
jgi:hypothetical protein